MWIWAAVIAVPLLATLFITRKKKKEMIELTLEQLAEFDGSDPSKPIYVAIFGQIYDVSNNKENYGKGGGYAVFCGTEATRALGRSSLDKKFTVPPNKQGEWTEGLTEEEIKVAQDWNVFFVKKYAVVGTIKYKA